MSEPEHVEFYDATAEIDAALSDPAMAAKVAAVHAEADAEDKAPHCRAGYPGCHCDYHDPTWIAFAAEYGIELPEVDETCRHHAATGRRDE